MNKEIFSTIAIIITFYAFIPYIRSILTNQTRPHVFSWIIWGITTLIVFFAQLADNAGIGAYPIGISGTITIAVAILAYLKKADDSIKKIDWLFFISALAAIPIWYLTANPLWAVVILTNVDLIGFAPTLRKAYQYPDQEHPLFYALFFIRNILVIMALEHYSLTTILFPAVISTACIVLIITIYVRRRLIYKQ